jgi:hypothetical protein
MTSINRSMCRPIMWRWAFAALCGGLATFSAAPAIAFKLSAQGSAFEKSLARTTAGSFASAEIWLASRAIRLKVFGEAVHEEIAQRIFGCDGDAMVCAEPDALFATPYVLAGVRWNDDPPFQMLPGEAKGFRCDLKQTIRFTTQPLCWYQIFRDAEQKAMAGKPINASTKAALLARSHYGDLQFLHGMASQDGETAAITRQRIMMWAEFTWRVATREYRLDTQLKDVPVAGFKDFFGQSDWRVQDLFTLGNVPLRPRVSEVAFGSLLHTVMDSFAAGHVDRGDGVTGEKCTGAADRDAVGRIREFHSYTKQDAAKHGDADHRAAFAAGWARGRPHVIQVGMWLREYWEKGAKWEEVKPYVECIFAIDDPSTPASPGPFVKE